MAQLKATYSWARIKRRHLQRKVEQTNFAAGVTVKPPLVENLQCQLKALEIKFVNIRDREVCLRLQCQHQSGECLCRVRVWLLLYEFTGNFNGVQTRTRSRGRRLAATLAWHRPGPQRPQQGALFGLVILHATQDVVQRAHRLRDMRPLVEHHTFGPLAHGRIGNFSA